MGTLNYWYENMTFICITLSFQKIVFSNKLKTKFSPFSIILYYIKTCICLEPNGLGITNLLLPLLIVAIISISSGHRS